LLEPYDALAEGADVTVCYANPNIAPEAEYARRRDTLLAYAEDVGIAVHELPYEPERWAQAVAGTEGDRVARCRACYELRIGMVAAEAAVGGYDAVATTLTVSPYQDPMAIVEAGEAACAAAGVRFHATDFRDRYPEATRRSRDLGMYRQNYCGCAFSAEEADADRAARKAEKAGRSARSGYGDSGRSVRED
jgi:hypothetical protein